MTTTTKLPGRGEDNFVSDRRRLRWLPANPSPINPPPTATPPCATQSATLTPALLKVMMTTEFRQKKQRHKGNHCELLLSAAIAPLSFFRRLPLSFFRRFPLSFSTCHTHIFYRLDSALQMCLCFRFLLSSLCWYTLCRGRDPFENLKGLIAKKREMFFITYYYFNWLVL